MPKRNATQVRDEFADTIHRAADKKERIIVHRRGKPVAAVVPIEDLRLLEELEDRVDQEEARRILADPTEDFRPWKEARQELGL
jgi:prevent-host-death family protein